MEREASLRHEAIEATRCAAHGEQVSSPAGHDVHQLFDAG